VRTTDEIRAEIARLDADLQQEKTKARMVALVARIDGLRWVLGEEDD
jgi:hypothetical protein